MTNMLLSWLVLAVAVWLTAVVLPGIKLKGFAGAIIAAALFGILNWAIGWLLFVAIGIGTLGIGFLLAFLSRWVVNAILLKITGSLTDRLTVKNFGWALAGALIMSGVGTAAEHLLLRG